VRRTLLGLAAALGLLLVGGGLLWYLAYGTNDTPPPTAPVAGLSAEATIGWHADGAVTIDAAAEPDAYAALGFVHGRRHAWTAALWRQAALGALSTWFGEALVPADRHAHRLQLATGAREAYDTLPPDAQALLQAYAAGMNAAFTAREVRMDDALTLLRLQPEPWEAWHPLALERLFAWLGTRPLTAADIPQPTPTARPAVLADVAQALPLPPVVPAAFDTLRTDDTLLRRFLELHGFDRGLAWAGQDASSRQLVVQQPFGTSALPLIQPVALTGAAVDTPQQRATIPGTLLAPAGEDATQAWALLLHSPATLAWRRADTTQATPFPATTHHTRAPLRDAPDVLLTTQQTPDGAAYVGTPAATADSVLTLQWPGLITGTDLGAQRSLTQGTPAPFTLFSGDGLRLPADGPPEVLGAPGVSVPAAGGRLVSNHPWAAARALRLGEVWADQMDVSAVVAGWHDDHYSTWAAHWLQPMLFAVDQAFPTDPLVLRALVYLRNWDYRFDRSSIGASIVDRWAAAYHETPPLRDGRSAPPWIATADPQTALQTLRESLTALEQTFGEDLSRWRWERVQQGTLRYPVWSAENLLSTARLRAAERFAPHARPGRGHLSTRSGGESRLLRAPAAPATWQAQAGPTLGRSLQIRQLDPRADRFLERYMQPDAPPPLQPVAPADATPHTTRLLPAGE
jgi:hypothetical protein